MMWLAAMAYISSPRPRITIIWVPVHTKPALGPVEPYVIHLFYVLGALIFVARYPSWSKKALSNQTSTRAFPVSNPWEFMAVYVLYSEFLNFFVWLCVEIKILRRVRAES